MLHTDSIAFCNRIQFFQCTLDMLVYCPVIVKSIHDDFDFLFLEVLTEFFPLGIAVYACNGNKEVMVFIQTR